MAQQKVKFDKALAFTTIALADLGTDEYKALMLPAGAEVMAVNLEVIEAADASTTASIGFNDDNDFFGSALDVATAGKNHAQGKVTTLNVSGVVTLTLSAAATKGSVKLRVDYYNPSEKMTEIDL